MERVIPTIEFIQNGPILVKGLQALKNAQGQPLATKEKMSLCRCGASGNKPFCDGTHKTIGFSDKRVNTGPLNREKLYRGEKITIHDNRRICSHAAECVNHLPVVFKSGEWPWIHPDAADVDAIIEVVKKCPSGALSYSFGVVHYRDQNREPAIHIAKDGPYNVTGGIKLNVEEELQPPSSEHYSLCRCGASKNKPFCDGAHSEIDFKG